MATAFVSRNKRIIGGATLGNDEMSDKSNNEDNDDNNNVIPIVIGVDGGTESIRACCFHALTGQMLGKSCAVPYSTHHPHPGWAEQDPEDWYQALGQAVSGAVQSLDESLQPPPPSSPWRWWTRNWWQHASTSTASWKIKAIALDTTCCSVVALDSSMQPLRPSLLWMDVRAAPQAARILKKAKGHPSLKINSHGQGPLSAEWMIPKALWIQENEPEIWKKANTICEYQDYLNYKLSGQLVASACNAAVRWHWDVEQATANDEINHDNDATTTTATTTITTTTITTTTTPTRTTTTIKRKTNNKKDGRPHSLYKKLGISELANKLPRKCLAMGTVIGTLTPKAIQHLGLDGNNNDDDEILLVQGGPDAFVGMIGLGCIQPGQLCLITGSSHLHCLVTARGHATAKGIWGPYRHAPLPLINFAEGGQSSTGSIVKWAKTKLFGNDISYQELDSEASRVAPGSNGLVALETFQGSRTPITDPMARGALVGLSLSHDRAHIWRALLEAVCFGTRACIEGLESATHSPCQEIVLAGGVTRSQDDFWLQMHADVTGKPIVLTECSTDAPLLGCAILASVGAGLHPNVEHAVGSMVQTSKRIVPHDATVEAYNNLYETYRQLGPAVKPVVHDIVSKLRGGDQGANQIFTDKISSQQEDDVICKDKMPLQHQNDVVTSDRNVDERVIVSPSLLACDWANIQHEVKRCIDANAGHLHVDIFDGVHLDSPYALTFGPKMVQAIRKSCIESDAPNAVIDLHMCVDRPERYIQPMADAGATRFIFQWEGITVEENVRGTNDEISSRMASALALAQKIKASGMKCGISINPSTRTQVLYPLLQSDAIDLVDVLAVQPGFGGQTFRKETLDKIQTLKQWREENSKHFLILVDGGINASTAHAVVNAGADILVAGTFLFQSADNLAARVQALKQQPIF